MLQCGKTSNLSAFKALLASSVRSAPAESRPHAPVSKKRSAPDGDWKRGRFHGRGGSATASRGRGGYALKAGRRSSDGDDDVIVASVGSGMIGDASSKLHRPLLDLAIPEVTSLSDTQMDVLNAIQSRRNVFASGRAGSGKSWVVHALVQASKAAGSQAVVTAASGIAASQVNGVTLHSLCCLGIDTCSKTPEESIRSASSKHRRLILGLDILVIDEVSMLSAETLAAAFLVLRSIRGNLPLIVLVGDFCQLPPSGRGKHALESGVWNDLNLKIVLLTSAFRQADAMFVRLLDEVRVGSISEDSLLALQSRVGVTFPGAVRPTTLTPLRSVADAINDKELAALNVPTVTFAGTIMAATFDTTTSSWVAIPSGTNVSPKPRGAVSQGYSPYGVFDGMEVSLPLDDVAAWQEACALVKNSRQAPLLTLAVGAQVIFTANVSSRICNGTRGVVKRFDGPHNYPIVELISGEEVAVTPFSCTKRSETLVSRIRMPTGVLRTEPVSYVFRQLPMGLGWGMTIHKSQGMSIDCAEIDLGDSVFSKGQAYVALSRLRSFNGLALISFSKKSIKSDDRVVAWYRRQEALASAAKTAKDDSGLVTAGKDEDDENEYAEDDEDAD